MIYLNTRLEVMELAAEMAVPAGFFPLTAETWAWTLQMLAKARSAVQSGKLLAEDVAGLEAKADAIAAAPGGFPFPDVALREAMRTKQPMPGKAKAVAEETAEQREAREAAVFEMRSRQGADWAWKADPFKHIKGWEVKEGYGEEA